MIRKIYLKAYLNKNLGDDLFIKIFSERYKDSNFITMSKEKYQNKFKNIEIFNNKKLNKYISRFTFSRLSYENVLMNKCDFTVVIGGSMFMENKYYKKNKTWLQRKQMHLSPILRTIWCWKNKISNNIWNSYH